MENGKKEKTKKLKRKKERRRNGIKKRIIEG
jgi:hypothetical protein